MTAPALPIDAPSGPKSTTVAAAGENDRPNIPHPAYNRMRPRWDKCRALMGGTEAVRAGGIAYLPMLANESLSAYDYRRKLCAVFNGFKRTVKACAGLLLAQNPELGEDMPPDLAALWEDFDLQGTHGDVYALRLVSDALIDGHAGTLVDYPPVANPAALSEADEAALGLRPYAARYRADAILKALWGKVAGRKRLVLLVLQEAREELVGAFDIREVVRYRVFRHTEAAGVTWELWRADASGTGVTRETDAQPVRKVDRIPFEFLVAGEQHGDFETRPPLEDLADLNLEHHQLKTDIRNLESLACVPTQVRIGAEPDENGEYPPIELGPRHVIEAPATDGVAKPVYWHTPDVTVLDPASRSLQDIKADMGAAGLAFLAPDKRVAETAEAKRLDATAQNATLSTVSRALQDHLEAVFMLMAAYMSKPTRPVVAGSVTLSREFERTILDPAMLAALVKAAEAGKLSIETFLAVLERFRVLPEGFDKEKELERILREGVLPPDRDEGGE